MSRKKIDKNIIKFIESSILSRQRSIFFICGGKAREQVVFLHHLLLQCRIAASLKKPSLLWCFKKDAGLNIYHQNKKLKQMRKKYAGNNSLCKEDVFDHFLLSSDVQFCHCSETEKILGQTFGMLIIQDFEALTPNILARIVECVEGGGMILFLLPNIISLEEDVHARYVTEAHSEVVPRFNKRFVLSLVSCKNCLILDDSLKIRCLPEDFGICHENPQKKTDRPYDIAEALSKLPTKDMSKIFELCCTTDQFTALLRLSEALKDQDVLSVVSLTSGRGRGKSALLGIAISLALCSSYSNIFVTSPHLDNLQTLFSFAVRGLNTMGYNEGVDYQIVLSDTNLIARIKVFRGHTRTVSYLSPVDVEKVGNADLVVLDEAAAIPLTLVKKWIGFCTVFMASTISGYEGTGRSLSLKLVSQLRNQSVAQMTTGNKHLATSTDKRRALYEIQLNEAIRYSNGDAVEEWINHLLCLDASIDTCLDYPLPQREQCELYYVNRDVLFSYNKFAERFLQQIVSLFVSSHYKNSPNDLLMMADAPAHHIFCLLPPGSLIANTLPTVLCVVQISLEGKISKECSHFEQSQGRRASGDLIPWIISQQFQDKDFPSLSSARVVRIATHPDYQRMGYGQRSLEMLSAFYSGSLTKIDSLSSIPTERRPMPKMSKPLLSQLKDIQQEPLDYLGVSYGLTTELFKFWKRAGFFPLYIRQTTSEVTGEHSCVMIKDLNKSSSRPSRLPSDFFYDFLERFASLATSSFKGLPSSLVLNIFHHEDGQQSRDITSEQLQLFLTPRSIQRLNAYCLHQVDYHLILDLLPMISRFYILGYLGGFFLSSAQESVLISIGLQNKLVEETATELNTEAHLVMGCFRIAVKKILQKLTRKDFHNDGQVKNKDVELVKNQHKSEAKQKFHHNSYRGKHKNSFKFENTAGKLKKFKKSMDD